MRKKKQINKKTKKKTNKKTKKAEQTKNIIMVNTHLRRLGTYTGPVERHVVRGLVDYVADAVKAHDVVRDAGGSASFQLH